MKGVVILIAIAASMQLVSADDGCSDNLSIAINIYFQISYVVQIKKYINNFKYTSLC